ncbi:solute carrier family 49 member A3 isoform X2 [Epinephelus fuscoguttatus]|uniref:solute carrier family 49 member A3 isoform X2 n=1 Tax=Epinephelus fuscoguttatus TaxID=293821 RepID=UPI0020D1397E|nr:solute carrier family 49 member A3 isoform X2 [Epinephelus fuscoguttatus]
MEYDNEASTEVQTVPSDVPRTPNTELRKLLSFKLYKRRWFVLLVLCLLNCSNATIWLTFAPVADQSAQFLKVSLEKINWLSLIYMVVAIPFSLGTTWMLDSVGLRSTLILGAWLNMFGALLRFFGTPAEGGYEIKYHFAILGQTLGALAQPFIIFTPTKLAALWFPDHQRATANMIASMSNPLGILLANIISPMVVKTSAQIPDLLLKNKAYLILLVCFGSGIAVFTCFSTLLEQILCVQGYTNDFAGICGALFIVFGIVGAAALGLYIDKTKNFIEATKINMSFTALSCIAFSVVSLIPNQKAAVAAVCSLFGFFGFSIYPVSMELSVECSYPVGEATSAGLIFVSGQVQSVLYIVILQLLTTRLTEAPLSTCGDAILSWKVPMLVMAGLCSFFTCCFLIFFNTRYRRLEAEEQATYRNKPCDVWTTNHVEHDPSVET